jgi:hypothetical protein
MHSLQAVLRFENAVFSLSWCKRWLIFCAFGLCALSVSAFQNTEQSPQLDLPRTRLALGMHIVDAQVAVSPLQLQKGLMFRSSMPENEGMLFDFGDSAVRCFWMKNTLIPLTAAFLDEKGRIINFADMQPFSEKSHCSKQPARYVLEMKQGWFKKRGIKAGQKMVQLQK